MIKKILAFIKERQSKIKADKQNVIKPITKKKPKVKVKENKKTICVDFDGVIHAYTKGWNDGKVYDDPIPGAIEGLAKLQRKNYAVVIFTARQDFLEIGLWLKKHDTEKLIDFNNLIITSVKVPAIAYIDDRAVRFNNWQDTLNYF
jgi:phosphoglycolate phosphatase-like HAD superfamily hydrolase